MTLSFTDTLASLKALSEDVNQTATSAVTGDIVPTYTFYVSETDLPGGTLQVPLPVGIWFCARWNRTYRESGTVGSPPGQPNLYWCMLLDSVYKESDVRITEGQAQAGLADAIMAAIVPEDGQPCFDGVEWATAGIERPPFIRWGNVNYRGSHIVAALDQRYNTGED